MCNMCKSGCICVFGNFYTPIHLHITCNVCRPQPSPPHPLRCPLPSPSHWTWQPDCNAWPTVMAKMTPSTYGTHWWPLPPPQPPNANKKPMDDPTNKTMTVMQVAQRLQLSRPRVYQMCRAGELPRVQYGKGRKITIPTHVVEDFIAKHTQP